jgi:hypothetical protein
MKIKMIAGAAVQMISMVCPSNNFRFVRLLSIRVTRR